MWRCGVCSLKIKWAEEIDIIWNFYQNFEGIQKRVYSFACLNKVSSWSDHPPTFEMRGELNSWICIGKWNEWKRQKWSSARRDETESCDICIKLKPTRERVGNYVIISRKKAFKMSLAFGCVSVMWYVSINTWCLIMTMMMIVSIIPK